MLRASVCHNKQVDTSFSYKEHLPPKPGKNLNVLSDLSCMIIILKVLMFQTTATDRYCQYCDRGYKSVKSLRAHMRHAHFLAQEPYCDRCLALSHLFFDGHAPGMILEQIPRFIIEESHGHCGKCDSLFAIFKHI